MCIILYFRMFFFSMTFQTNCRGNSVNTNGDGCLDVTPTFLCLDLLFEYKRYKTRKFDLYSFILNLIHLPKPVTNELHAEK